MNLSFPYYLLTSNNLSSNGEKIDLHWTEMVMDFFEVPFLGAWTGKQFFTSSAFDPNNEDKSKRKKTIRKTNPQQNM